jgi:hypothetical protein
MTLFWHGHFVSGLWDGVDRVDLMVRQNQLYRTHALGNFLTLTQLMAIEPAMLLYLSNANNVKGAPNENFAREFMELFTLGVGNYAEEDVAASARAWTGHNYSSSTGTYTFRASRHDTGPKDVLRDDQGLGRTGHRQRGPARQCPEARGRGTIHREEAVGVLRPSRRTDERRERARRRLPRARSRARTVAARALHEAGVLRDVCA